MGRAGALVALLLILLAGCGGPPEIEAPDLSEADAEACADFVDALPETLSDLDRVDVEPADAPGAAYGDPAIVITCGVDEPADFAKGAPCESVAGIDWFVPAETYGDEPVEVVMTSAWSRPRVRVEIPDDYWPEATAAATGVLSPIVKETLDSAGRCDF